MKDLLNGGQLNFIGVDFDNTLANNTGFPDYTPTTPIKGAKEAMIKLKTKGFKVYIYTARASSEHQIVKNWLKKNKIPFKDIICGKQLFRWTIDDKSIGFRGNWKETLKEVI